MKGLCQLNSTELLRQIYSLFAIWLDHDGIVNLTQEETKVGTQARNHVSSSRQLTVASMQLSAVPTKNSVATVIIEVSRIGC